VNNESRYSRARSGDFRNRLLVIRVLALFSRLPSTRIHFQQLLQKLVQEEVAFRTRNNFDLVYIFNRPQLYANCGKKTRGRNIVFAHGNDHLKN